MRVVLFLAGALAALPATASAQGGVAVDLYRAAETPDDGFAISRPTDRGHLRLSVQLHADYALAPLVLTDLPTGETPRLVSDFLGLRAGLALGLIDRLVLFGSLPVVAVMDGQAVGGGVPNADGAGLGDPELGARLRLIGEPDDLGAVAIQLAATIPLAEAIDAGQDLRGEGGASFAPEALGELRFEMITVTGNVGFRFRSESRFTNLAVGHEFTWGIGVGASFLEDMLEARLEAYGSVGISQSNGSQSNPAEAILGLRAHPVEGLTVGLAGGFGLGTGYGTPAFRGVLSVGWADTADHERRAEGRGWDAPEPGAARGGHPTDSSTDQASSSGRDAQGPGHRPGGGSAAEPGTPTSDDGASHPSGEPGGHGATDGRPPTVASDHGSGEVAARPNYEVIDRDGDRIVDANDRCPLDREDYDEIQDDDGCPEADADGDELADVDDQCPLTPGSQRRGECAGCPELACVSTTSGQIEITQRVQFETNEATILERSEAVLNDVLSIVTNNTQIERLRIEGHTDGRGEAADNLALSRRRAAAVVRWLVERGVERSRLAAFGCGERHLVGVDRTRLGRQRNRRVEFLIVEPPSGRPIYSDCVAAEPGPPTPSSEPPPPASP